MSGDPAREHRAPVSAAARMTLGLLAVAGVVTLVAVVALAWVVLDESGDVGPGPDPATVVIDSREVRTVCIAPGLRGFTDPGTGELLATGDVDYGATRWGCP